MKNFTLETDSDGIALITWDMPGRSMNVIDAEVMDEIDALIESLVNPAIQANLPLSVDVYWSY